MKQMRTDIDAGITALQKNTQWRVAIKRLPRPELVYSQNAFRALARSIVYQQLSGKAAGTIFSRFIALYTKDKSGKKFPKPEDVLATPLTQLRAVGLSNQKASYLHDLAAKFIDKTVDPKHFRKMTDAEISEHVIRVKGIAQWSADMFLIFALNRPNVLPTGDLGIQKGAQLFFKLKTLPKPDKLRKLAKPYDGHHTVFSLYLWKLADEAKAKLEVKSIKLKASRK